MFRGLRLLGRFELEDLIWQSFAEWPVQICSPKKTRRENLSPRIMMQERVMKIIASDRVPPSPDLPGPRPATLRSLHCPERSPQQGKIQSALPV